MISIDQLTPRGILQRHRGIYYYFILAITVGKKVGHFEPGDRDFTELELVFIELLSGPSVSQPEPTLQGISKNEPAHILFTEMPNY